MDETLIDLIYEAAIIQETWPIVLLKLSALVASIGGVVFAANEVRADTWMASPSLQPAMQAIAKAGMADKLIRPQRLLSRRHAGFLSDTEFMTPEEKAEDHLYQAMLIPIGLAWTCGTVVPVPNGDMLSVGFQRKTSVGPFERQSIDLLDGYRPHLARAALLAARVQLELAQHAAKMLQSIGLAGAVIAGSGRVISANTLFDKIPAQIFVGAFDRLRIEPGSSNDLLHQALAEIENDTAKVRSIPVAGKDGGPALVAHVIPIRRQAYDIFPATALFICTPVASPAPPYAGLLCGLFDLTAAEERVARVFGERHSVESCAAALGVSRETVRTHLKSIMLKTGTTRQSELTGLLAGTTTLSLPRP